MIVIFKNNLYTDNGFPAKLVPWRPRRLLGDEGWKLLDWQPIQQFNNTGLESDYVLSTPALLGNGVVKQA